jgi:hypothetical protein
MATQLQATGAAPVAAERALVLLLLAAMVLYIIKVLIGMRANGMRVIRPDEEDRGAALLDEISEGEGEGEEEEEGSDDIDIQQQGNKED